MKDYVFEVKATVVYFGGVSAENEDQAKEKCLKGDYDDIIDSWEEQIHWDTIKIKEY